MDNFGRLPNEVLDHIKYCYDQPVDLKTLDDVTLSGIKKRKYHEYKEVEDEIERRALKSTRLIVVEKNKQINIVRENIYLYRQSIGDCLMNQHTINLSLKWKRYWPNKIEIIFDHDREGFEYMMRNQTHFESTIESYCQTQ